LAFGAQVGQETAVRLAVVPPGLLDGVERVHGQAAEVGGEIGRVLPAFNPRVPALARVVVLVGRGRRPDGSFLEDLGHGSTSMFLFREAPALAWSGPAAVCFVAPMIRRAEPRFDSRTRVSPGEFAGVFGGPRRFLGGKIRVGRLE
jgi:hypothetical protein